MMILKEFLKKETPDRGGRGLVVRCVTGVRSVQNRHQKSTYVHFARSRPKSKGTKAVNNEQSMIPSISGEYFTRTASCQGGWP
jgi:hypothetical protein